MRLTEMGTHFIEGCKRRGLGMIVKLDEDGVTTLEYKNGEKIATITNRTSEGFTLTIHPFSGRYGCMFHCNRINAIFEAISSDYQHRRYSSFQRWGTVRVFDQRLLLEIRLQKDASFTVKDGYTALDYISLERAYSTEVQPKTTANTSPATNNSGEAINNLMALVANI